MPDMGIMQTSGVFRKHARPEGVDGSLAAEPPKHHRPELQALGLPNGEDQLRSQSSLQKVPVGVGTGQDHPVGRRDAERLNQLIRRNALDEKGGTALEFPVVQALVAVNPQKPLFELQQGVGEQHDASHAPEVQRQVVDRGDGDGAVVEEVLDLLPAESAGVDDLLRITPQNQVDRAARQPDDQRELNIGEVLHFVAADEIIGLPRCAPLVEGPDGRPRQVYFVPQAALLQVLLVPFRNLVDLPPVLQERRGPFAPQPLVLVKGHQRRVEISLVLADHVPKGMKHANQRRPPGLQELGQIRGNFPQSASHQALHDPLCFLRKAQPPEGKQFFPKLRGQRRAVGTLLELGEERPQHLCIQLRLGAFDDRSDLLPDQRRVEPAGGRQAAQHVSEGVQIDFAFRAEASDTVQSQEPQAELPEGEKLGWRLVVPFGQSHQAAIQAL
jgi:hypothetical protein